MKKLLLILLFVPLTALAQVHVGVEPPEDWAARELLRVTILQTGRSDAILVECGGEAMLIDGGDASQSKALEQELQARGLTEFRCFLNTHPHNDHIEGLIYLMQRGYRPGRYASPFGADWHDGSYHDQAVKTAWDSGIPFRLVRHGDVLPLGKASVTIWRSTAYTDMNSRSAVQLITFGDSRILLLADLSGNAQKDLMKLLPEGALQAEIVKAPHHGENAMVTEFLDETAPALLLCTAGAADAPDLARQAASRELPLLYSGEGAIVLVTDGADWYAWQEDAR